MSAAANPATTQLDFEQIRQILPHRFPLILVDRVIDLEPGSRIVALKNVTGNELHFLGHFPHVAIMPGVLIIEAAAQAVALMCLTKNSEEKRFSGTSLHYLANANMSFRVPVRPGDQMVIEAGFLRRLRNLVIAKIKVLVAGNVAADGEVTLAQTSEQTAD
jgi:3-hydroxyacyl-[acyl-carrier-protein] dehydratase